LALIGTEKKSLAEIAEDAERCGEEIQLDRG
jgi:hypothetical protein